MAGRDVGERFLIRESVMAKPRCANHANVSNARSTVEQFTAPPEFRAVNVFDLVNQLRDFVLVQAGRDAWSLALAFGEVVFQRTIMERPAADALEPGHIVRILDTLQCSITFRHQRHRRLLCHEFEAAGKRPTLDLPRCERAAGPPLLVRFSAETPLKRSL